MTFTEWWIDYRGFDDPYKGQEILAWNAAIEECAKRCETYGKTLENNIGDFFAEQLRSMKEHE